MQLEPAKEGMLARLDGREVSVRRMPEKAGSMLLEMGGRLHRVAWAREGGTFHLAGAGATFRLEKVDALRLARSHQHHEQGLEAPMPGLVRAVAVAEGDAVERGQTLVVLEAMKMEIRVTAPEPSRVMKVHCAVGSQVERGQVLVDLDSPGDSIT